MKKFVLRHWIIFIAVLTAFILVFLFVPFISSSGGFKDNVNPCPQYNGEFGPLCNLDVRTSLYGYLLDREPIDSINWNIPLSMFFIIFVTIYGELKMITLIIRKKSKKYHFAILAIKVLAIAAVFYVNFFILIIILSFFGLSLFPMY